MENNYEFLLFGGVIGAAMSLIGKIVFDWLKNPRRNGDVKYCQDHTIMINSLRQLRDIGIEQSSRLKSIQEQLRSLNALAMDIFKESQK